MEDRKTTEPKQIIVVNKSLEMPPGKLAAQVSHASLGAFFKSTEQIYLGNLIKSMIIPENSACEMWVNKRFTKVVLYVKSEEKLTEIFEKANKKGLPCILIEDAGFTFFEKPTKTCVGIGPCFPGDFIGVTDKLQVLK